MSTRPVMIETTIQPQPETQCGEREASPLSFRSWAGLILSLALAIYIYSDTLSFLLDNWLYDDNYSHGLFIPVISLFLIWNARRELWPHVGRGSWWGAIIVAAAGILFVVGEAGTLHFLLHISFWMILAGLTVCVVGVQGARTSAFPLLYLLTAIPLPGLLHQTLSGQLQLLSSSLGVGCLQLVGVMAYQEGNVIDLGPIQLQVVEACSGLRYLFPLVSLSLLCAYLYQDRFWKRALVFLSSVPIAVMLNGFRIGMIGVLVDNFGSAAAEGFGHFFEGWIFFVASLGIVLGEIWLLGRVSAGTSPKDWGQLLRLKRSGLSEPMPGVSMRADVRVLRFSPQLWCSFGLIGILAVGSSALVKSEEIIPSRSAFLDFRMQLGPWQGVALAMEKQYLDVLKLDDYLLANYANDRQAINLYVGYYGSQQKGRTPHSPAACIPGGGWAINSLNVVDARLQAGSAFPVNRAVIQKGDEKQLVLYWFKQRDRLLAQEGLVKFYLFWDSVIKHRSDGALVRLVTPILSQDDETAAERRLLEFAELVSTELPRFVPD